MKAFLMATLMNRFVYLFKNNIIAALVFFSLALTIFFAWFFFHPSSFYNERLTLTISFNKVGPVSSGSFVQVNGIRKGSVVKTELTDQAVYVTIRLLADDEIPRNSSFRLINTGLVGKQEVSILVGKGNTYVSDGDTVFGVIDQGFSDISRNMAVMANDLDSIKSTLSFFLDSLKTGSTGKSITSIQKKGLFLIRDTKKKVNHWAQELKEVKEKAVALVPKDPKVKQDIEGLLIDLNRLLDDAEKLKNALDSLSVEIPRNGNVGLMVSKSSTLLAEIDLLGANIERLTAEIKKKGLALNVDIF